MFEIQQWKFRPLTNKSLPVDMAVDGAKDGVE